MDNVFSDMQKKKFSSEILSAEDARKRALNASRIIAEEELKPVFIAIRKSSGEGKLYVDYVGDLSGISLGKLNDLGYKVVEIGTQSIDEPFVKKGYKISWEFEK